MLDDAGFEDCRHSCIKFNNEYIIRDLLKARNCRFPAVEKRRNIKIRAGFGGVYKLVATEEEQLKSCRKSSYLKTFQKNSTLHETFWNIR